MQVILFYGSAGLFAGVIIYCLERWKAPLEAWRHDRFGDNEIAKRVWRM